MHDGERVDGHDRHDDHDALGEHSPSEPTGEADRRLMLTCLLGGNELLADLERDALLDQLTDRPGP